LVTPRTEAPGLAVAGWENGTEPSLNGARLALDRYEAARSLALTPNGENFVLGAESTLRLFDRTGKERWRQDVPETVWAVNVSGDGRLVVAAYGDGMIRWHRLSDGAELLAFYPDGDRERWVVWTPQGYYMASPGGEDLIGWQVNKGRDEAPEFFTASRFRDRFYRPDVVQLVLDELDVDKALLRANREAGGTIATPTAVEQSLPPVLRIVEPADGTPVAGEDVIIRYEAEAAEPVRSVMALVNGQLALRQPRTELRGGLLRGRLLVPVPHGDVVITLLAESAQGASDPVTIRLPVTGGAIVPAVSKPSLHMISIGVSEYAHDPAGKMKLKFAAKDATDVAERFLQEKGDLYGEVRAWPLPNQEANRRSVLRTFREASRMVEPGDVVMVYLSGHGASEAGRYYYLPHDAETDSGAAIQDTGISHLELRDALRRFFEAKAKVIAFVDTCYSGGAVEGARAPGADVDILAQELKATENGVVVITSSTGKEISREREDLGNGIFTSALLEGLAGAAARDGYISIAGLRAFLPNRVAKLSQNQQHPTVRVPLEQDWEARIAAVR
jgi:hypothetical protein